jgi:predicted GNAT family acetyltransferase
MARTTITTRHDAVRHRIEAVLQEGPESGDVAGYSQYHVVRDGIWSFFHTEVDDRFEGQGIGSQLAAGVMDFLRDHDLKIVPACPFLRSYMVGHAETHDLLAPGATLPSA